ncbi:hypothetical protein [Nocardia sp. NPDC049149]|uniref:hypothetical protein n=1 Tax=Nocardia sp. NPDC049149 TaxID=3364315 RepID=UPI00371A471F
MLIALEGIAASGKSTLRNQILDRAQARSLTMTHLGQFSWLSLRSTRSLVALRTGRGAVAEDDALGAVLDDLALHMQNNLAPAARLGDVIADRLVLSTACMLATAYQRSVGGYVNTLIRHTGIRPDLTILVTTAPELCQQRLAQRRAASRPTDNPDSAVVLDELYQQAASESERCTGTPLWRRELNAPEDAVRTADEVLNRLLSQNAGGS